LGVRTGARTTKHPFDIDRSLVTADLCQVLDEPEGAEIDGEIGVGSKPDIVTHGESTDILASRRAITPLSKILTRLKLRIADKFKSNLIANVIRVDQYLNQLVEDD